MPISRFFIDRPIFAAVVSLFITIVGAIGYLALPVTQFPEISPPTITVSATYPGAGAQTVADTVAAVIEQEINGVDGMIYMYSQSTQQGTLSITVTFDVGYDIDKAQVLVQNRVAAAEPRLPEEVRRSGVQVRKNSPDLLLVVHMISPDKSYDQVYISNYALLNVSDALARIPGVGEVRAFGAREYSMRVWLDPERIAGLNLTAEEILAALRQQNVQVAGGAVGEPPMPNQGAFEQSLQLRGRLIDPREFEDIVIKMGPDGRTVKLKDVARVELGAISYNTYGYMDRVPATVLAVTQAPGSDALKTARDVKAAMAQMAPSFPKGLEYRIIYNPTEFIEVSIHALMKTILEAIALVVLVIIVFLQTWRATLVPLLAIPISLIGTCAVMLALGYSINSLTLFGLVLSVGIVVDDAIVVVENVERRLREGLSPMDAARATMDEVGTALIAIALVLVAVFVPSAFVGGITGAFFRQFAVTIATATIISVFVSLTLSPSLCARLFKPHEDHDAATHHRKSVGEFIMWPVHAGFRVFNRGFDALSDGYARFVRGLSWTAPIMLLIYAGLMASAVMLVRSTPTGFIPATDRGIVTISMTLPPGASIERSNEVFKEANDIILATPGFKHTSGFVGRSGATFTNSSNAAALFSVLEDHDERDRLGLTIDSMTANIRQRLSTIKDAQVLVFVPPAVRGMGNASGFSMRLQDRQALGSAVLYKASQDLIDRARQTPGISNIFTTFQISTPQVFVDVDRVKAQMLRVPVGTIFEALRVYMGSAYVNDFNMFGRPYKLVVQADASFRADPDNISRIRVRNADGQMVPLGSLVTFREISGPERVPRYNLFPTVEVNGTAAPGISSGQALDIMQQIAADVLPPGVTFEWTDLSYQEKKAGRTGYLIFALSVLFVFLALSAQYESWSLPFSIILIVPMCLLAATFGVWMEGKDINILTQISFVVLIGLASKNAILIVEFARQIEEQGKDVVTATVEACRRRLRPIVMTSLAFTLGVVPLYLATGAGYEMRQALGIAVFWGMIGVTLFGLVFTPVFYITIRKLTLWRKARRAARRGGAAAASATPAE
ncbi:MAG TPA: multidrug efflux RND transporter permease subunit [Hyphomicrobiaceae bacterium]|nr:multidrug efflux RND transporter permease subunit [Hyphomicrobiaceae bacterium]